MFVCRLLSLMDHCGISFLIILIVVVLSSRNISPPSKLWACVTHPMCATLLHKCGFHLHFFSDEKIAALRQYISYDVAIILGYCFCLFHPHSPPLFLACLVCQPIDYRFVGEIFSTSTCIRKNKDDETQIKWTKVYLCKCIHVSVMYARIRQPKWYCNIIIVMRDRWDANIELIAWWVM